MPNDPLVLVALSGGVDSAVAAWRLLDAGYRVQGLHMTNWEGEDEYCSAADDLQHGRRVCEHLGIPLHHVNFADEYAARVFRYFLDEYEAGRTPNPDVLCNREIKFGECLRHAQRLGADYLATGHYARLRTDGDEVQLLKSVDADKDQTYFLHAVPAEALRHAMFPLGDLTKSQVRAIARDVGFGNWDRKDSTGICFIGERPFREFLATHLQAPPGPLRALDGGELLGTHQGLIHYTLGQRAGIGVGGRHGAAVHEPWYVAGKDLASNTLTVVQGHDHPALFSTALTAEQPHWIAGAAPHTLRQGEPWHGTARLRHRQPEQACTVSMLPDGSLRVEFAQPQRAVAPGQFAVFYDGEVCLGGAAIQRSEPVHELLKSPHSVESASIGQSAIGNRRHGS